MPWRPNSWGAAIGWTLLYALIYIQLSYPIVSYLTAPQSRRQQMGAGLILASAGVVLSAILAALTAAAGILLGASRLGV